MTVKEQLQKQLKGIFTVKSIADVNHNPHLFVFGSEHVGFASKNYGGMMGDACIEDKDFPKCAHHGCTLKYDQHTSDKLLFLSLQKNITNKEANEALLKIKDLMIAEKIDGVALVETPEKFRIESEIK